MKFSLSSLQQFLETNATAEEIAQKLTAIGLEVEEVQHMSAGLESFTVAHILSTKPHPDADKLRICEVATHDGTRQIVCGAPNARAGIKVALADIGAIIPANKMVIKPAKIRGIESQGMLCSASELRLNGDSEGIIELPSEAEIGAKIIDILGLNDVIFIIAITPNRGDCLGVYGIARDLAASKIGKLKDISIKNIVSNPKQSIVTLNQPSFISINSKHCTHFVAYKINGVTNAPSPKWLATSLESLGQKSISALVDVTNYFSLIFGRPLHIYDADKLSGSLQVRDTLENEQFQALGGGATHSLPAGACVIADDAGMQAVGGIIGGAHSGCTLSTTNIILESAWFDPIHIAHTGRLMQIDSDARYRFERGVDPESTAPLAALAVEMLLELCGGTVTAHNVAGEPRKISTSFAFDADYINSRLGLDIPVATQIELLESLGCEFSPHENTMCELSPPKDIGCEFSTHENTMCEFSTPKDISNIQITTPSWRSDITEICDIAEEVARLYGYDNLSAIPMPHVAININPPLKQDIARGAMLERGIDEVVHFAFTKHIYAQNFKQNDAKLVLVQNPISSDLSTMRPHLYAGLLQALASNIARGNNNISFGEVGNVFFGVQPHEQPLQAAGMRTGGAGLHWRGEKPYDIFTAKADLFNMLSSLGVNVETLQLSRNVPSWYHPAAVGQVALGAKNILGYFGELHPAILRVFGIEAKVFAFECWLDNVPTQKNKRKANYIASEFQASRRDFAFVADVALPAGELHAAIKKAGGALVKSVALFDIYQGANMEQGKKSLAYGVTLQANDRTMQEADISSAYNAIIAAAEKMGAKLR